MFSKSRKASAGDCSKMMRDDLKSAFSSSDRTNGTLFLAWCRLAVASEIPSMNEL